ncbi:hypothetical protein RIF29_45479 [Crotalaria pallida]|uniref:Uncharacterized protein n=1 Tax=Crotalaria pallida TaxID=3830 RepID=A0AAN9DUT6_CROPI
MHLLHLVFCWEEARGIGTSLLDMFLASLYCIALRSSHICSGCFVPLLSVEYLLTSLDSLSFRFRAS